MVKQNENTKTQNDGADKSTPAESSTQTGASTSHQSTMDAARAKRAESMSVAGKKEAAAESKKADKKPAFVIDEKARQKYIDMTDEQILKAAADKGLRAVDINNTDVYEPTGNTTDFTNGQDVSRSAVRSAVLYFLSQRPKKQAPVNVIVAYMNLTAGVAYKGKFDFGYLTTKDGGDGKRGMVARKLIQLVKRGEPAKKEEEAKTEA